MNISNLTRTAVLQAIEEFDQIGKEAFLEKYGYSDARNYFLEVNNRVYPSKAIAGVAVQYINLHQTPLKPSDFVGGKNSVEKILTRLGYKICFKEIDSHFWWVNHNQTAKEEITGGYIWSPKTNRNGLSNQTYGNLQKIKKGDLVFSYSQAQISALGTVVEEAISSIRPVEFTLPHDQWNSDGWLVKVDWMQIEHPYSPKENFQKIQHLLPEKFSPINRRGNGNQPFYLIAINYDLGDYLLDELERENSKVSLIKIYERTRREECEVNVIMDSCLSVTEKDQLVKARIGQGIFRRNLENIEDKCRVTNVSDNRVLIASHIKPWRLSTNSERLDGANGLLLSPHIDKLFDNGWMTISEDSKILCFDQKIKDILIQWNVDIDKDLGNFSNRQKEYLAYHRLKSFSKGT
jgi:putative restriction endonuclease